MKLRIKLFPITEDGEQIYHGGYFDIIKLDLVNGIATTWSEYVSPYMGLYQLVSGSRRRDDWYLFDNRDGRDEQTILQYSIDGFTWHDWDWALGEEEDYEL